jgi:hypothetical protein
MESNQQMRFAKSASGFISLEDLAGVILRGKAKHLGSKYFHHTSQGQEMITCIVQRLEI